MASPAKDFRDNAQINHPGSIVVERGKRFIKHKTPDGKFILDYSLGQIHYGTNYQNEIDTAWVDSTAPWDKEMTLANYNAYALTTFSNGQVIKYIHPASGESITFQPQQLQFTNDLDQIQSIGNPQTVTAFVDDDTLIWSDAFGFHLNFAWEAQTARLAKKLTIDNLVSLGTPAQYIIDGGNPVLRLQFIFQISSNIDIYINGEAWDKTKTKETTGFVEFRNKTTGLPLWWFGNSHAIDNNDDEINPLQRFTRKANNLLVELRIPWAWLQGATYPVLIDPTITDQVDNGYNDAYEKNDDTQFTNSSYVTAIDGQTTSSLRFNGGVRFEGLTLNSGDSIDVAYLTVYPINAIHDDPSLTIYCEDVDDSNSFNTTKDVNNRTKTSASTGWSDTDIGITWQDTPSLVDEVQEVIDRGGWSSGNDLTFLFFGSSSIGNLHFYSYDGSTSLCPKLHIEYTAGGSNVSVSDGLTIGESVDLIRSTGLEISGISDGLTIGESVSRVFDPTAVDWYITESDNLTIGEPIAIQIPPAIATPIIIGKQETTYEVWLCDQYGRRLTFLDNIISLDIVKVANAVGYGSVTLPDNFHPIYSKYINIDSMIEFWRSPSQGSGRLESVFFIRDIVYEEDVKGNDLITLSGPDANDLLDRRIIAYYAGSSYSDKTDYADDMMKAIVRENLGSLNTFSDRDLTDLNFTVADDISAAPSITKGFAWRNVLKVLTDIAGASAENGTNLYFDVVPVIVSSSQIGFQFRTTTNQPGQDRTYDSDNPVIFSKDWGNLSMPMLRYDYNGEVNYVYGGGQGEGIDRLISEQTDLGRIGLSVWNRREKFADARNEATANGVANSAEEELNAGQPLIRFTGDLLDTPQARYGVDWFFGDKVEINYRGIQIQGIAGTLRMKIDREGNEILTVKVEVI